MCKTCSRFLQEASLENI